MCVTLTQTQCLQPCLVVDTNSTQPIFFSFPVQYYSCLNDAELGFLGAPWPRYYELALRHNIEIIRLPMLEGSCPHTIEEIDAAIDLATEKMKRGENVLTHCRGGEYAVFT